MCFMLCRLKYDYNDFNTVSFIIIWCYDVSYCDVNPAVQLQKKTLSLSHVRAPSRIQLGRFRQILDSDVESIIAEHALDIQQRFYGLSLTERPKRWRGGTG